MSIVESLSGKFRLELWRQPAATRAPGALRAYMNLQKHVQIAIYQLPPQSIVGFAPCGLVRRLMLHVQKASG